MNRIGRGLVVLGAVAWATACSGDPTDSLRGGLDRVVATPSVIFVNDNDSAAVLVEAVDRQGNRLAANFSPGTIGSGLVVTEDLAYNSQYNGDTLAPPPNPTRVRYFVRPTALGVSSFDVQAGSKTATVDVTTLPAVLAATVSAVSVQLGDTVQVTLPTGFTLSAKSVVRVGGKTAVEVSRDVTGSIISFYPVPGGNGPVTITNVVPAYATGIVITRDLTTSVAVDTIANPISGTDAVATAPQITFPAIGGANGVVDGGAFLPNLDCQAAFGADCKLYKIVATRATTLAFGTSWENGNTDMGLFLLDSTGTAQVGGNTCDSKADGASSGASPFESCAQYIPGPGTYFVAFVSFGPFYAPDPDPKYFVITIKDLAI